VDAGVTSVAMGKAGHIVGSCCHEAYPRRDRKAMASRVDCSSSLESSMARDYWLVEQQ
jgi:hypothetical protein